MFTWWSYNAFMCVCVCQTEEEVIVEEPVTEEPVVEVSVAIRQTKGLE